MITGAIEIPYIAQDKILHKGIDGNWSFPQEEVRVGVDWYLEKLEIIGNAPEGSILLDVGCKDGHWTGSIHEVIPPWVKRIGIDPIDNNVLSLRGGCTAWNKVGGDPLFHHYVQCACSDLEGTATLNLVDEPGCNSLLQKSDHLNRNVVGSTTVKVRLLESIISEIAGLESNIHYLKCDCQGADVNVVKGLRSFLRKTNYVQIESSFDKNRPFYDGQSSVDEDVQAMIDLGFDPIYYVVYGGSPLPEGEVLFKRRV